MATSISSDGYQEKLLLVRSPSPLLKDGLVTHIADERSTFSWKDALEQWNQYVTHFLNHGWKVVTVPPAEHLPDSVFVEDTVVVFPPVLPDAPTLIVLSNPGAPERKEEVEGTRETMRQLATDRPDLKVVAITGAGTLDGGDVLKDAHARVVYVGSGARTNPEGIRQLRAFLRPLGYVVKAVPMTKALHLKSAATALPDGTVLLHRDFIDDVTVFPSYIEVPEEHGVAVVALDDETVIMSSNAPRTAEMIRVRGYKVVTVNISEYQKLEGCPTCLSVRVRRR
ncbi:hypothetical protein OC861_003632 [Tilletia horrida]|nr:hypothetical protein OC845_003653 [Tilletia horrida]KAK0565685.1 hypothetical protein OC861_003632 [Tilletia horrida]